MPFLSYPTFVLVKQATLLLIMVIITDRSKKAFLVWICFVKLYLQYFDVCFLQPCGHMLGESCPHGFLVCDVFMYFFHFPIRCPGSGVVLNYIDS